MMSASMQGALAFQKGLGCMHTLSHSLGGIDPRLHHGKLNEIFLPAVIPFNEAAASVGEEDKLDRMAKAMDLASGAEVGPSVRAMTEWLGLPTGLAQLGRDARDVPRHRPARPEGPQPSDQPARCARHRLRSDARSQPAGSMIGGEWVEGPRVSRNINPSDTRDVIGEFAQADAAQARQAIAAATQAQSAWGLSTPQQRFDLVPFARASAWRSPASP